MMKEMATDQEHPAWPGEAALQEDSLLERASAPTLRDLRAAAGELLMQFVSSSNAAPQAAGAMGKTEMSK